MSFLHLPSKACWRSCSKLIVTVPIIAGLAFGCEGAPLAPIFDSGQASRADASGMGGAGGMGGTGGMAGMGGAGGQASP